MHPFEPWSARPGEALALSPGEVHVWGVSLRLSPERHRAVAAVLAPEEQERAARLRLTRHRDRYVAGRGLVRHVLAAYLGEAADRLRLARAERGKPFLADWPHVGFNLSHADDVALIAVAAGRAVGVDLERIRPVAQAERIARRFFSPRERADLEAVPAARRQGAFFACWTRKEAYLKARGDGLWLPLHGFTVSVVPGRPAALLEDAADPTARDRWRLEALDPGPGYAAAVCAEGRDWSLRCCWWPAA